MGQFQARRNLVKIFENGRDRPELICQSLRKCTKQMVDPGLRFYEVYVDSQVAAGVRRLR